MFVSSAIVMVASFLVEDSAWLVDPRKEFHAVQVVVAWVVNPRKEFHAEQTVVATRAHCTLGDTEICLYSQSQPVDVNNLRYLAVFNLKVARSNHLPDSPSPLPPSIKFPCSRA